MTNEIVLKKLSFKELKTVHALLYDDFHEAEIKPCSRIRWLALLGKYSGYALYENGEMISYALFYEKGDVCLLDYFVVREQWRNLGVGSRMLRELAKVKSGIIVESSDPDYALRDEDVQLCIRRLDFYSRNGYEYTGLASEINGEHYLIFAMPGVKDKCTLTGLEKLYREIFGNSFYDEKIKLSKKDI